MTEAIARGYLAHTAELLGRLAEEQGAAISAAAEAVARTLVADGLVHVFGSGHSHLLALEGFYRAGGLAAVDPILLESLMLHGNAALSTVIERSEGLGEGILADLDPGADDCLIVISNSGGNRVAVELAAAARERGMTVIAIVSAAHAGSAQAVQADKPNLLGVADVVIDNLGEAGDASVTVEGIPARMGPTSTVVGAAIIHAVSTEAAARAVAAGTPPAVFASSNVAGGDERNAAAIARYRGRVRSL